MIVKCSQIVLHLKRNVTQASLLSKMPVVGFWFLIFPIPAEVVRII